MNTGKYFSANNQSRFWLDPRTKIVMLVTVSIIVMCGGHSGASHYIRPVLAMLPCILLMAEKRTRPATLYFLFLCPAILMDLFVVGNVGGLLNLVILVYSGLVARFLPGIMMGYYFISTTKISELIAAMERMHIPQFIVIPFAVMIRFFPTVGEENSAIGDAMRMRGVRLGGGNAIAMLEYRVVPMLMSAVKIGEELSAAALTRGLGAPVKRTNICKVGFRAVDCAIVLLCASFFILWILF